MILCLVSPSVRRVINTAIVPVLLVLFSSLSLTSTLYIFPYSILPGSLYTYHCYVLRTIYRPGQISSPLLIAFLPTFSAAFSFPALFSFSTTSFLFLLFHSLQLSLFILYLSVQRTSNHPNGCPSFYFVARPAHPLSAAFRHAFSATWLAHHRRQLSPACQCGGQSIFVHCPECARSQARMPKTVLESHR